MTGSEIKFVKYMEGSDKRFVIPVYQRNYDWNTGHCKRLYDDLVKIIQDGRSSHFFGSLVAVYNPDAEGAGEEYQIIDGQQRITTVSLLFLAMHNLIAEGMILPKSKKLKKKVYENYLVDAYVEDDEEDAGDENDEYMDWEIRLKLKPIKNDQEAFKRLFGNASEFIRGSNITENYKYFYDRIQKQEITIDQLYNAICKLEVIKITLNDNDDPQLIFECLNSTGMDLSEGDKIRNFILMGLPTKLQDKYYEKYWNKIETCTNYGVSAFVRDYLSVKQQAIPSQKKIYADFREYVEFHELETEPLLADLLDYARRYEVLLGKKTGNTALDACIYRLNRLETTVTRPFFLEVLRLYDEGELTMAQVTDVFLTTENYIFRRSICDLPTNALNKIFLLLHREIMRYDGTDEGYVEKFKYALLSRRESGRFPDDAEFAEAFIQKPVYLMNSKNKIYILERLENFGTIEDKDIYRHCDDGTYSIEHIMPQHLTPAWQKELGEDYAQIHEIWLHRIANLTLTAYNSKYSNSPFEEKKTMPNGFIESGIKMNMYIAQKDKWTLEELEERSEYLKDRALEIWTVPVTEFKPKEKQLDSYTLEDEAELTGRRIAKFTFKGSEQPVESWVEMYQKVLQILYEEDKTIITKLAISDNEGLELHFSFNPEAFSSNYEIGDGIRVWTNTSTQSKLSVLNKIFALYDEDPNDLVFYLRNENDTEADEPGSRQELRRRYWSYALPEIKKANEDNGAFSNVNPSKENWVSGFFGVGGFNISCVANYDSARIDLFLGKAEAAENKKAFDYVISRKEDIESALGVKLTWDRGDDKKSSKVSYQLDGVSIENEIDWKQMAQFHAEWSRKFNEVLVPYLLAWDSGAGK